MVHDLWFDLISAAADDQLSEQEEARLHEHLAICPPCAQLLATFESERRRARFQSAQPHPGLVTAVLTARTEQIHAGHRATRTLARRAAVAATSLAAAIMAVVMVVPSEPAPVATGDTTVVAHERVLIDAGSQSFDQTDIEVAAGTTVVWRNAGGTTHKLVRKLGGATVTEELQPGQSERATFAQPGTYEYYCTIHPEMTGTVTVDA